MRRPAVVLIAAVALLGAKKLPLIAKLNLVQAQCAGPPVAPCAPAFRFAHGTATLVSGKQPTPTCPRTGNPSESPAGTVELKGVTKDGAPFAGALTVEVVYKTTFGGDQNGNCDLLAISPITAPSLIADLRCTNGKCKGTLLPIACLPKTCADAAITSEIVSLEVREGTTVIAVPGTTVAPYPKGDVP